MSDRALARHRADLPPSTPFTGITTTISTAVGDHTAALSRGGVVIAVSSGLVAAMGLPASASTHSAGGTVPRTASVPLLTDTAASPVLSAGVDALASAPVSASSKARVTFDHSAFKALPKRTTAAATPASASRDVTTVSRSLARQAFVASRPKPVHKAPRVAQASEDQTPAPTPAGTPSSSVVAIAMRYLGIPYRYGGASPRGFDCSGFTMYVFDQIGVSLPRTAGQQYQAVTRIARSAARPGDLIFYLSGGGVSHVGIYLGDNKMIAAPHTGANVRVQEIYSANVAFGRP